MAPRISPIRRFALTTPDGGKRVGLVGGALARGSQPITVDGELIGQVMCTRRIGRACSDYVAQSAENQTITAWGTTMKGAAAGLARRVRGFDYLGQSGEITVA